MKLECIIIRKGGSKIDIDGTVYHFKETVPGGPHVAEVASMAHVSRFLAIPEGYRLYEEPASARGLSETVEPAADPVAAVADPPETPVEPPASAAGGWDTFSDEDLDAHYLRVIGTKPHPRAHRETKIARIEAAQTAA